MKKPWYLDHMKSSAVMNRIAARFGSIEGARAALDKATQMLWSKIERYYVHDATLVPEKLVCQLYMTPDCEMWLACEHRETKLCRCDAVVGLNF